MAVRIGVVADKGGVGRTDLVRLLAETFASAGMGVICVDMDYQAILSRRMGYDMHGADSHLPSTAALMRHDVTSGQGKDVLTPCRWTTSWAENIQLLPSTGALWEVEENPGRGSPTGRLVRAMTGVDDSAHVTLFDTRPDMGIASQAVWAVSDYLVGITPADRDGSEGILRMLAHALTYAPDLGNADLRVAGVLLNEYSARSAEQHEDADRLREGLATFPRPIPVFETALPLRTYIRYSASRGLPLETYLGGTSQKDRTKLAESRSFMEPIAQHILEATNA